MIVLDEPTNYLDRDSLGALSKALKSFEGGVIIITHSAEFTKNLTEEVSNFSLKLYQRSIIQLEHISKHLT